MEIFGEEGETLKVAELRVGMAVISRIAGDLDSARGHLREALGTFAQARETMGISGVLTAFALVANDDGLPERAARLIGASARIRDELGGGIPPELIGTLMGDPVNDAAVALGVDAYGEARAAGYAMDIETAVAYARGEGGNDKAALVH